MAEPLKFDKGPGVLTGLGGGASPLRMNNDLGTFEGFLKSSVWSIPELVGVRAPDPVQKWRANHPMGDFTSGLLGMAVPYVGWAGASTRIPLMTRALSRVSAGAAQAPIRTEAVKEMVRFAPFEAARIGIAGVGGEGLADAMGTSFAGTGNVALNAAFDLGLAGVAGGGIAALRGYGKKIGASDRPQPGADLRDAPQLKMRAVSESLRTGKVADVASAQAALSDLGKIAVLEEPVKGTGYLSALDSGSPKVLNRLWAGGRPGTATQKLTLAKKYFQDEGEITDFLNRAKVPEDFLEYAQFPRRLVPNSLDNAMSLQRSLTRNMRSIGDGWYWGREGDEGLFAMARRVAAPKPDMPAQWLVFKTDQPGKFVPSRKEWADAVVARTAWMGSELPASPVGAPVFDEILSIRDKMPLEDFRNIAGKRGKINEVSQWIGERTGLGKLAGNNSEIGAGIARMADAFLFPTMFQFRNSPRALRINWAARAAHATGEGLARLWFAGERQVLQEGSLYKTIWSSPKETKENTISSLVDQLYAEAPEQLRAFQRVVDARAGVDEAAEKFGLGTVGVKLLRELSRVDKLNNTQKHAVQKALGEQLSRTLENHYLISHSWAGTWRVPVFNAVGKLIAVGAGQQRKDAIKHAERLMAREADKGTEGLWMATPDTADFKKDQVLKQALTARGQTSALVSGLSPKWHQDVLAPSRERFERLGVKGFVGEDTPWTKQELKDLIYNNLMQDQKYLADLSVRKLYENDLAYLRAADTETFQNLMARLDNLAGEQGPTGRLINQLTDRVLAPALGKNSATKVVATMNKAMALLTFGFYNMGFNVANMLTFMQTTMPHLAFLMTAAPERAAKYYSYWPIAGEKSTTGMGVLDAWKITRQSFAEMGNPNGLLRKHFEKAAGEGVWDPAFLEEFVGQGSRSIRNLRGALKGDQPFSQWLWDVAMYLPAQTEKFSRGQAFVTGHIFGRDVLGLTDDALYRFSKEFTEKTQFLYGTADRARIITGPLGSPLGLFKNWLMHYIGWMAAYTGEGVLHGNWKPLLLATGTTGALGGAGALPLFGAVDTVSKWLTDSTATELIYGGFAGEDGSVLADAAMYGLPAFLGFSIQNQVAAPFADPGRDATMMFNFAYLHRMQALSRGIGSAIDHWQATGQHPGSDPQTRDALIQAFAPKSIYRTTQVLEGNLRSLTTGYPMLDKMGLPEAFMYSMGVTPTRVENAYWVNQKLWSDQEKMRESIQERGNAWADAITRRDMATVKRVLADSVAEGVDVSSVIRSAKTRLAKGREDMIDRQFSAKDVLRYKQLGMLE